MRVVTSLHILILQLLLYLCSSSLYLSQFCASDFFILFRYFKRVDISASLPDPKDHKIAMVVWVMCTTTFHLQHFSSVLTLSNFLVDVVSSDHRACSNNDSTLDSTSHTIACDDCTTSHNLVIGYFVDIIIADITAMKRNWYFAEIGPRRQNPLYDNAKHNLHM